jgi:hypothetical protein
MGRVLRVLVGTGVLVGTVMLGGCSISIDDAPTTVGSAKVADTVETILEEEVGRRPDVDCGVEDFALENGESRTCVLTDPETGLEYEASVVLADVDGSDFRVDVEVADQPIDAMDTPSEDPVDAPATLMLTGAEIGATATSALAGQLDGAFEIFCDEGDYEVTVGTQLTCTYADDAGDTPAYIEITAIDGTQYELSVSVP